MAYIYGSPGQDDITASFDGRKAILLRIALPLLFLLALASAGLHAFLQGSYILTALSAVFFVFLLLRFEELGLTLAQRLSGSEAKARADRMVAKTLRQLPDGYHVFHDLDLGGVRIDHAVVGPNGFFPIMNRTNLGRITVVRDSLRLSGWPFLRDVISLSWRKSQTLLRHLDLGHAGHLQVCPVLCFSRASVESGRLMRGVMIAQVSNLARQIQEHESTLGSEKLLKLTDKLAPMVRAKTNEPEITHQETLPGQAEARPAPESRRRACSKCHHVPSDLEAELFPGECPRCGRLHAAVPDAATTPSQPEASRTPAAALVTACLIVAAGSALLGHQAGLFDSDRPVEASMAPARGALDAPPRTPEPAPAQDAPPEAAEAPRTTPAAEPARPDPTHKPEPAAAAAAPQPAPDPAPSVTPAAGAPNAAAHAETVRKAEVQAPGSATPAGKEANATAALSAPDTRPAAAKPQPPRRDASVGTLTIVTARPVTLWLTNDQTAKRFGPYETSPRKALDIVLPKGFYSVVLVDNGRRRKTTVSFLADAGRLEF
ncbi:hypothetical protein DSECCO2_524270 [anaerobic digester metagenome]